MSHVHRMQAREQENRVEQRGIRFVPRGETKARNLEPALSVSQLGLS